MTRILITGSAGMLGQDLVDVLGDYDLTASTRTTLDITNPTAVDEAVAVHDVVINAAAYTAVDDAETHRDTAFAINAEGPRNLARAAARHGKRLIHVSTDYVFDGNCHLCLPGKHTPAIRNRRMGRVKPPEKKPSKAEYPDGSIIIRTAWLYGQHGGHFPATMLRLAEAHETVSVVTDQVGQPHLESWIWRT